LIWKLWKNTDTTSLSRFERSVSYRILEHHL
jgi:hypothetical protein